MLFLLRTRHPNFEPHQTPRLWRIRSMKIHFWSIGKNNEAFIKEGVEDFTNRISKYYPVEWTIIPLPKNAGMMSELDLKKKEGEIVLESLKKR